MPVLHTDPDTGTYTRSCFMRDSSVAKLAALDRYAAATLTLCDRRYLLGRELEKTARSQSNGRCLFFKQFDRISQWICGRRQTNHLAQRSDYLVRCSSWISTAFAQINGTWYSSPCLGLQYRP